MPDLWSGGSAQMSCSYVIENTEAYKSGESFPRLASKLRFIVVLKLGFQWG